MFRIRKPSPALVVAVVALVAALGGVAVANPLASDGKVTLCYSQSALDDPGNGSSPVYIVNAGRRCDADYPDTLTINQTGPRGLTGPAGHPGPIGPIGPIGPQGLPGVNPLGHNVKHNALADLEQVDKKSDSTEDKLQEARRRLHDLINEKGEANADALGRQLQALMEFVKTTQQQLQTLQDVNQSVIRKLAR